MSVYGAKGQCDIFFNVFIFLFISYFAFKVKIVNV